MESQSAEGARRFRLVIVGGALVGAVLVAVAALVPDTPAWLWWVGLPLLVVDGTLVLIGLRFRLRHRTPEARADALAAVQARREVVARPADRSTLAHRATKHKKDVLRDGVDGTAVVQFLADGGRANEFRQLVYLELEVTVPGSPPYLVRTGEYLTAASSGTVQPGAELVVKVDPADGDRVAVDWEQSLRLR
ncbi:MAG TPA: hypothetical protein VK866_17480 [Acidimicrobiales bacterium]|nr:hypothetical protein [Acidimicrobiales bacterium]